VALTKYEVYPKFRIYRMLADDEETLQDSNGVKTIPYRTLDLGKDLVN